MEEEGSEFAGDEPPWAFSLIKALLTLRRLLCVRVGVACRRGITFSLPWECDGLMLKKEEQDDLPCGIVKWCEGLGVGASRFARMIGSMAL